jgi:hypothetical protein
VGLPVLADNRSGYPAAVRDVDAVVPRPLPDHLLTWRVLCRSCRSPSPTDALLAAGRRGPRSLRRPPTGRATGRTSCCTDAVWLGNRHPDRSQSVLHRDEVLCADVQLGFRAGDGQADMRLGLHKPVMQVAHHERPLHHDDQLFQRN